MYYRFFFFFAVDSTQHSLVEECTINPARNPSTGKRTRVVRYHHQHSTQHSIHLHACSTMVSSVVRRVGVVPVCTQSAPASAGQVTSLCVRRHCEATDESGRPTGARNVRILLSHGARPYRAILIARFARWVHRSFIRDWFISEGNHSFKR